jgi:hypothetical protein
MKPIETRYKGYRFRSRLEARWAVFFDAVGEGWEYEKEGYETEAGWYLPDFYLPRLKVFIEIKGAAPSDDELAKVVALRGGHGCSIVIFQGLPGQHWGALYTWDIGESSGGASDWQVFVSLGEQSKLVIATPWVGSHTLFADAGFNEVFNVLIADQPHPSLRAFCEAAKAARFEHGESG